MRMPIHECPLIDAKRLEIFRAVIHDMFREHELDGFAQLNLVTILFVDAIRAANPPYTIDDCDPVLREHAKVVRAYLEDAQRMAA